MTAAHGPYCAPRACSRRSPPASRSASAAPRSKASSAIRSPTPDSPASSAAPSSASPCCSASRRKRLGATPGSSPRPRSPAHSATSALLVALRARRLLRAPAPDRTRPQRLHRRRHARDRLAQRRIPRAADQRRLRRLAWHGDLRTDLGADPALPRRDAAAPTSKARSLDLLWPSAKTPPAASARTSPECDGMRCC